MGGHFFQANEHSKNEITELRDSLYKLCHKIKNTGMNVEENKKLMRRFKRAGRKCIFGG